MTLVTELADAGLVFCKPLPVVRSEYDYRLCIPLHYSDLNRVRMNARSVEIAHVIAMEIVAQEAA